MAKAQELKVLEIGGQRHFVEEMSKEVQDLVDVYNEWNQDFFDARTKAAQLQAAVQTVQNQIGEQIKAEAQAAANAQAEAEAAATSEAVAEGLVDPADGEPLIDTEG